MPIPKLEPLNEFQLELAQMVAKTSWLPHPDTVKAIGRAVFPTKRARKHYPRLSLIEIAGETVGMYDDNFTPAHALLWAHGLVGGSAKGWCFAHVWPDGDEMASYTHLANLALVPECFAGMTDKEGPLTGYLRWHAWGVYGWKPESKSAPSKPTDYDEVKWRYLDCYPEPKAFIRERIQTLNNERIRILRPIMERRGLV